MDRKIGIIDLGSNSVRLVIYEIKENGASRLIDDISDTVRLSENMIEGIYLNDFSMRKSIKTIKLFKKLCSSYNIPPRNIIAVATAAVRKAENRDQFLQMLQTSTGLNFRLLSGEEEALYVYNAVIHSIDVEQGIIVDIGGGSTEIIKFRNKEVINHTSIPIGAVVTTEDFLGKDVIIPDKVSQLEQYIESLLLQYDWITGQPSQTIIGLGGTIRNLAKIHRRQSEYPLELTHNYNISVSDFNALYNSLKSMDLESRKKVKGMSAKRADIIVGGLTILKSLIDLTSSKNLIISGNGLREGILFEYIFNNKPARKFTDVLNFSLDNYIDLYGVRREHAELICSLSLSLFDQLKPLHMLGVEERRLLRVAALLHDIGISVGYYGHHLHTFYLVINSRLNGLSHREIVLVAAIAAAHGKDKFKDDWDKQYKNILKQGDVKVFRRLSMLLRISECLDRSETGIVKAVECYIGKDTVIIKTLRNDDAELELSLANENAEVFKKIFHKSLVIQ